LPWATALLSLAAIAAHCWPALTEQLIYDRSLLLRGQLWRGWSGHVVHNGASHVLWNLAVFLPAGGWLEMLHPRIARWFYALCPLAISALLFVGDPSLLRYAGLSGLATGVLALLAGLQLRHNRREPAWFWLGVLALIAVKMALEFGRTDPLFVQGAPGIRNVPLAHLGGVLCAALTCVFAWGPSRRRRGFNSNAP
jgi:rhomboid family GlyGly-CTERM serine protease